MSLITELIKETPAHIESFNNIKVKTFEVPTYKYFARREITYLALTLDINENDIVNKINETKLGRKTIEKIYAYRHDSEPWTLAKPRLPDLIENNIDADVEEISERNLLLASLHVNNIKNFVRILLETKPEYRELTIVRLIEPKCTIRYWIYI